MCDKGKQLLAEIAVDDQERHLDSHTRELLIKADPSLLAANDENIEEALKDLEQLSKEMFLKYPLLVHVCDAFAYNNGKKDTAKNVVDYINLIDKN